MIRIKSVIGLVAALFVAASVSVAAQTVKQITPAAPPPPKQLIPGPRPTPFLPGPAEETYHSIQFRTPDQMSEQDRNLEADAESSIAEHAGYQDLDFNQGKWSYSQIVCPAFPNHLFLRFTRNQGTGDLSVFSASIPRNGAGRVRIIPILRRSYSLFSPAPVNEITIAAFNHIRAEDKGQIPSAWMDVGLCYAALAGANPQVPRVDLWAGESKTYPAFSAGLSRPADGGGAIIRITDVSARPHPMRWTLVFDGKGKLLKAEHGPAPMLTATEYHPKPAPQPVAAQSAPAP